MFKWFFAGTKFVDNSRIFWNLLESLGNWESHLCYHYWVYWYWFDQDLSCHFVYLHHLFHFGKLRMFEHQHWQYWYHNFLGNLVGSNLENKREWPSRKLSNFQFSVNFYVKNHMIYGLHNWWCQLGLGVSNLRVQH